MANEKDDPGLPMPGARSEEWTHQQNIRNFRAELGRERSETRRATLAKLLAEEEWKLERIRARAKPGVAED